MLGGELQFSINNVLINVKLIGQFIKLECFCDVKNFIKRVKSLCIYNDRYLKVCI